MLSFLKPIPQLSAEDSKELLDNDSAILLDVRTVEEARAMSIPGAMFISMGEITQAALEEQGVSPELHIIVQCHSGGRSQRVCRALQKWGYEKVSNLAGGIVEWHQMGYETISK